MKCGLLGRKLSHSYSPQIHTLLGDYDYSLFEKEPEELEAFLKKSEFTGLNVTIPYKKDVIAYLDVLSPVAAKLGAVNTIVRKADGTLIGHNSDYFGFQSMLARSGLDVAGKKVLVLGSGGASATAVAVLQELGARVTVVSRSGEHNYENLHLHADTAVIVNTTPVGMYPHVEDAPLTLSAFPALEGVLDIIYNPARTKLLMEAEQRGIVAMNGLWMLVAQAKESAQWFTGRAISDDVISDIYGQLKLQMENIILIGMPGCGKSTIGKVLATATAKTFVDTDLCIEKAAGVTIPQIFAAEGEEGFRRRETQVLSQLGMQSGQVIATGGGCVTRPENYQHLHRNGTVICIRRQLDQLATEGRPLSQPGKLEEMYRLRKPLYHRFADHCVENSSSVEAAVSQILSALEV